MKSSVMESFLPRPSFLWRWKRMAVLLSALLLSPTAWAASCSLVSNADTALGSYSSLLPPAGVETMVDSGFKCEGLQFGLFTRNYLKVRMVSFTELVGAAHQQTIPLYIYKDAGATVHVAAGDEVIFANGTSISGSFSGIGGTLPLYVQVPYIPGGIRADIYTATVILRWYWSICTGGISSGNCDATGRDDSPGFDRGWFSAENWGSGTPAVLTLKLEITKDCEIAAPNLFFGNAPLVSAFNPASQTITIRCSAGEGYSVGLSDGNNPDGTTRRMRSSANNYLRYEIFKGVSGNDRWGHVGSERRESSSADTNPSTYDGTTPQSFVYRGVIDPNQATPPAGTYTDSIVVDVDF